MKDWEEGGASIIIRNPVGRHPLQEAQLRMFPAGRVLSRKHRELSGQVTFLIMPDISHP